MENHQTSNSTNQQDPNHVALQIDSIYQELNVTLKTNDKEDENE